MKALDIGTIILFLFIMLISGTISGMIGFAGNIIALPLLSQIMPMPTAVAILALVSAVQAGVQAVQHRRYIQWKSVTMIVAISFVGMPFGAFSLHYLPEAAMKGLLGVFVFAVAAKNVWEQRHSQLRSLPTKSQWDWLYLVGGGFFSGAFAAGGPLSVIYCTKHFLEKDTFRSMMFSSGFFMMALVATQEAMQGQYTAEVLMLAVLALLSVVVAIFISNWLARRVDTGVFRLFVNIALLAAGTAMLLQAGSAMLG